MKFPQIVNMTNSSVNNLITTEDFRLFIARIVYGMLFFMIVLQMILQHLPYQLPLQSNSWLMYPWIRPTVSIVASTAVLVGFFIPTRAWSTLTAIFMLLFNFCYADLANNSFYNFIWWVLLIPFCLKEQQVYYIINKNKWLIILFAAVNGFSYGFSLVAIPLYILYLLPFLPYKRLFDSFNKYYEPR